MQQGISRYGGRKNFPCLKIKWVSEYQKRFSGQSAGQRGTYFSQFFVLKYALGNFTTWRSKKFSIFENPIGLRKLEAIFGTRCGTKRDAFGSGFGIKNAQYENSRHGGRKKHVS